MLMLAYVSDILVLVGIGCVTIHAKQQNLMARSRDAMGHAHYTWVALSLVHPLGIGPGCPV